MIAAEIFRRVLRIGKQVAVGGGWHEGGFWKSKRGGGERLPATAFFEEGEIEKYCLGYWQLKETSSSVFSKNSQPCLAVFNGSMDFFLKFEGLLAELSFLNFEAPCTLTG